MCINTQQGDNTLGRVRLFACPGLLACALLLEQLDL